MRKRLQAPIEKARELQAKYRVIAERQDEHRREHISVLRELAEMALRTLRRRRYGDG